MKDLMHWGYAYHYSKWEEVICHYCRKRIVKMTMSWKSPTIYCGTCYGLYKKYR